MKTKRGRVSLICESLKAVQDVKCAIENADDLRL